MWNDCRLAWRSLWATPGFTILAVLTLALGLAASAAVFTVVDNIARRGLDVPDAGRVQRLYSEAPERGANRFPWSEAKFRYVRERQSAFERIAADTFAGFTLTGIGEPELLNGLRVTPGLLPMLGITPVHGRLFRDDEEEFGPHVVVVSESFWTRALARDAAAIGRTLMLDDTPYEIIGVIADPPVTVFGPADVWVTRPFSFPGYTDELRERGVGFLRVWGRLRHDVSPEAAAGLLGDLTRQYAADFPSKVDAPLVTGSQSLRAEVLGPIQPALFVLLGAVLLVLLIAGSNVANLLLARFTARRRDVAVRMALGSSRHQVIRLLLIESVTVSVVAVGLGLVAGQGALRVFSAMLDGIPVTGELVLNTWTIVLTSAVAMLAGLAAGAYPASQAARTDLVDLVKEGGRSLTTSRGQHRFRMAIIGGQVALSVVLLVGALLLLTTLRNLEAVDLGFEPDGALVAGINLPSRYGTQAQQTLVVEDLLTTLRARPGIAEASAALGVPMTGFAVQGPYSRTDPEVPFNERPIAFFRFITDGYLDALRARVVEGRSFDATDRAAPERVVLVSERLARTAWPGESAVGRTLLVGSRGGGERVEVIGVVRDMQTVTLTEAPALEVYRPFSERLAAGGFVQVVLRSSSPDARATVPVLRAALDDLGPAIPIVQPQTLTETVGGAMRGQRLLFALLGAFAATAVVLAAVGLYGVVAFVTGQRVAEIGVRLAVGARPGQVLRLVWRQGMTPVVIGTLVGLFGAALLSRLVDAQLFGTSASDPVVLATSSLSLLTAAAIACLVPAWRASRRRLADMLR